MVQAKNDHVVPTAMMGAVSIVTLLYTLMALSLIMLVPYNTPGVITSGFASAFDVVGMHWYEFRSPKVLVSDPLSVLSILLASFDCF